MYQLLKRFSIKKATRQDALFEWQSLASGSFKENHYDYKIFIIISSHRDLNKDFIIIIDAIIIDFVLFAAHIYSTYNEFILKFHT